MALVLPPARALLPLVTPRSRSPCGATSASPVRVLRLVLLVTSRAAPPPSRACRAARARPGPGRPGAAPSDSGSSCAVRVGEWERGPSAVARDSEQSEALGFRLGGDETCAGRHAGASRGTHEACIQARRDSDSSLEPSRPGVSRTQALPAGQGLTRMVPRVDAGACSPGRHTGRAVGSSPSSESARALSLLSLPDGCHGTAAVGRPERARRRVGATAGLGIRAQRHDASRCTSVRCTARCCWCAVPTIRVHRGSLSLSLSLSLRLSQALSGSLFFSLPLSLSLPLTLSPAHTAFRAQESLPGTGQDPSRQRLGCSESRPGESESLGLGHRLSRR